MSDQILYRYKDTVNKFKRDTNGLLECINYSFHQDNTINWRSMINKEYLVPNRDAFKNQKDINLKEIDVSSLADNQLLILLAGIKELAQIRGYKNVSYDVIQAQPDYVAVKCTINWISNYETDMQEVSFSALADAHLDNTKDFAKNFLMAIAENRAFIRAVRSFLKINIVGNDEIGKTTHVDSQVEPSVTITQPIALLQKTMQEYSISFEQIKERAIQKKMENAENWSSINDINPLSMFTIISAIKNKNKNLK
ncbi:MAG: hypothetical protein RIQ48_692 [Pseudomonadota bacterium]|jgi:hypothetical protein